MLTACGLATILVAILAPPLLGQKSRPERKLTLHDVDRQLAELAGNSPMDYMATAGIGYGITGQSSYDQFFRRSAIAYGGFYYGRRLVTEATDQLKRFARSKAAVASLQDEVNALTQEADTTEWTAEQSLAVLAAARKRDELSTDEKLYFLAMSALLAATVPVVRASVQTAPDLVRTGRDLTRRIPNDFDIFEAPQMVFSVNRSMKQISAIPGEGSSLLESLVVLSRGFQMLSAED
ncbi:MAG: hypothetical protein ACYC2G_07595 [Gemmatimonadaceae bacterium]